MRLSNRSLTLAAQFRRSVLESNLDQKTVFLGLMACWVGWAAPFVRAALTRPHIPVVARQPAARWGLLLQTLSYFAVWPGRGAGFPSAPAALAAGMLAPVSVVCAWSAVHHLGVHWRIQAALSAQHELVGTGPYRLVRHPIYASMLGMLVVTGLLLASWPRLLAAIAIFASGTEIRIRAEERLLAARFGSEFEAYRARVPAYLPYMR